MAKRQRESLDLDRIKTLAKELHAAMVAAGAACGNNAGLLLAGGGRFGEPAIRAAQARVTQAVKALRPMLNPDGLRPSRTEMRINSATMTATVVYGDDSNLTDADLPADVLTALLTIRGRVDSLYAWLAGDAPEGWTLNMAGWRESFGAALATMEGTSIPANERTKPMSYRRAAALMGKGDSQDAAEWLAACVADGSIRCEHKSRQTHIFSLRDFPADALDKIRPTQPKST
jgi:hypothetical protein